MDEIKKQRTPYLIIGMLLSVSIFFLTSFLTYHYPGFLGYGYLKKIILLSWLLLVYLYAAKIEKQKFLLWFEEKRSVVFHVVSVLGLIFLVYISILLLHLLGFKLQTGQVQKEMTDYMHAHPLLLVITCVTAAVVEELIFRGYLIPRLNIFFTNSYLPVIIAALIFALAHIGFGTILNMLIPFLGGLIFGTYYQKYRNLKVLIFCHFLLDFLGLVISKMT